jgi:succinate dehydrogenase / fumarate reductase cytochrome b subunit
MGTAISPKESYPANAAPRTIAESLTPLVGSSIGGKAIVGITGLLLTGFVVGHLTGNLLIYAGQDALNEYAEFLKHAGHGALLWVARLGLLGVFVLHLFLALRLNWTNAEARPVRYVYERTVQASFASRYMVWTGIMVGLFVLYHLAHFTLGVADKAVLPQRSLVAAGTGAPVEAPAGTTVNFLDLRDSHGRHDVYSMVILGFQNTWVSGLYIAAQIALLLHLSHGVGSSFQSLGWNNERWGPWLKRLGLAVALLVALGNISIPLAVLGGFVRLPA